MDAFDADVLIYAAAPGHPPGRRVLALFQDGPPTGIEAVRIGSVLLSLRCLPNRSEEATVTSSQHSEQSSAGSPSARWTERPRSWP